MSDLEDGELPLSVDDDPDVEAEARQTTVYTPLERPVAKATPQPGCCDPAERQHLRPRTHTNSSLAVNVGEDVDESDISAMNDVSTEDLPASSTAAVASVSVSAAPSSAGAQQQQKCRDESSSDSESSLSDVSSDDFLTPDQRRERRTLRKQDRGPSIKKRIRKAFKTSETKVSSQEPSNCRFAHLANAFQESRARAGLPHTKSRSGNNVWGSLLEEESLNKEMTSIGVGATSLKKLQASDRGAEAYDFGLAEKLRDKNKQRNRDQLRRQMDDELDGYWEKPPELPTDDEAGGDEAEEEGMETGDCTRVAHRRSEALAAGCKRSIKDRLGTRKHQPKYNHQGDPSQGFRDQLDDMSIAQPGVSRTISDLSPEVLNCDNDVQLAKEMANKLCEPKTELMIGVLDLVGREVALELFKKTQDIESEGGMMIKNGARRRTPGGLFFQLLRDIALVDPRVDPLDVKRFFAQSNSLTLDRKRSNKRNKRRPGAGGDNFAAELAAFRKMTNAKKGSRDVFQ